MNDARCTKRLGIDSFRSRASPPNCVRVKLVAVTASDARNVSLGVTAAAGPLHDDGDALLTHAYFRHLSRGKKWVTDLEAVPVEERRPADVEFHRAFPV